MIERITADQLNDYEPYLRMLAKVQLRQNYQAKIGASDLVQQTLLKAVQAIDQFRGESEPELRGWLRQILARELGHLHRDMHRDKRDVRREQAIQQAIDQSSLRIDQWLADKDDSPSRQFSARERLVLLASSIEGLPDGQREAIRMRYLEGLGVTEIAEQLDKSVSAVAGLLHRGLRALREAMAAAGGISVDES